MFVTVIVFCTLSPSIIFLGWIEFAICRALYGYLFVYAETTKPDLGGEFYVTQMKHVQAGMHLYVVVMTGVLLQRSSSVYPGIIAGCSLIVTIWAQRRFARQFRWEFLEFNELDEVLDEEHKRFRKSKRSTYKQPELPQPADTPDTPDPYQPSALHRVHSNIQQVLQDVSKRLVASSSMMQLNPGPQDPPDPPAPSSGKGGKGSSKGAQGPPPLAPGDPFATTPSGPVPPPSPGFGGALSSRSRNACC